MLQVVVDMNADGRCDSGERNFGSSRSPFPKPDVGDRLIPRQGGEERQVDPGPLPVHR
jgi:hypothetical protein